MTEAELADLQTAVSNAWSRDTARQWSKENPAEGQCNVTAIVVQELAGGEILKTPMNGSFHFYNLIDGRRHDFTAVQFDRSVDYADIPSSHKEALDGVTAEEHQTMRAGALEELGVKGRIIHP